MKNAPQTIELLVSRKEYLKDQLNASMKYQLAANSMGLSRKLEKEIKKLDKQINKLNGTSCNWLSLLLKKISFKKGLKDEVSENS